MDISALEALVYDPAKCSKLSMEQKRELVYELSKWPDCAMDMLQVWSRQEILQILCAELGKERKYTGLTKLKIIEQLLKIICEKKSQELGTDNLSQVQPSLENSERNPKRQRKSDQSNRVVIAGNGSSTISPDFKSDTTGYCKNSACKAKMNSEDAFCKRCSCCICHKYDENKDPSLWLMCNSDPPFYGVSCSMSCHLECALQHENSGISRDRLDKGLDGSFCCVSCGKVNDLLSSWRKQLVVARDTRRVDILCYRISLGIQILAGTKHYQHLHGITDKAVKMLEEEVGPLTGLPVKKARGIVNRLSSAPEIQRLCASAVEFLDSMLANRVSDMPFDWSALASKLVKFEDIRDSSLTLILNTDDSNIGNTISYSLWHRAAEDSEYPAEPSCRLYKSSRVFLLSGLTPDTRYVLKVVALDADREMGSCEIQFCTGARDGVQNMNVLSSDAERSQSPATNCSSLSVEDESNNNMPRSNEGDHVKAITLNNTVDCLDQGRKKTAGDATISLLDEECSMEKINCTTKTAAVSNIIHKESSGGQMAEAMGIDNGCNTDLMTGLECIPRVDCSEAGLPITPCKFESVKGNAGRTSWPKFSGKDVDSKDFGYYVKVIRWLECEGHIEMLFRQKFLTWFSLRANPQEVRNVKVFIDRFIEEPESLAEQLVHNFSDAILNKRLSGVQAGLCSKFWH